ncbi:MAG: cytochrome P450 [Actinomycetota bacterium]|nr:cytochrome P450 [Actinomycetota bacterium]
MSIEQLETDPHPLLRSLRSAGPVSWVESLGGWLVTGRALAEHVLRSSSLFTVDDPRFSTAQVVGPSMLSLDGRAHTRHRDPFARQFRPAQAREALSEAVEHEVVRLVEAVRDVGHAEVRSAVAGPLAVFTMAELLGLGETDAAMVREWYDGIVAAVSDITAGRAPDPRGADAFAALRDHVAHSVGAGEHATLVRTAAQELSPDEVVSNAAVLLFGGIDTTEGMIANAVLHLLQHPDQLAQVYDEPALLARAIEESVRLEPAAAVVDRYATDDVTVGGASVRRGDLVVVSLAGANRDPAVFHDPDVFDLHRGNADRHLSFAHGPHFCIGAHLARMETHAALRAMLERLPGLRLDHRHEHAPRGLIFRKPPQLRVLWDLPRV